MKYHTSILDILNSKVKVKIIKFLLGHDASMSEREIASVLKVSHMSINRTLRELSELNFVNFITVGKAHLWKVNRRSYAFQVLSKLVKGVSEIKLPLEDLKKTILKTLPKTLIKKVILFGSLVNGSERPDSDIDIFILVRNEKDKQKLEVYLEKLSTMCLELYGNRLAPYILTEKEIKQRKKLKIISEVENGMQIFPEEKSFNYA